MKIPSKLPAEAAVVFKGISFDIYQWQQELYDGSFTTFEMAKRPNAVSIIPVIADKVVILHEEQPTHPRRTSFPGGHIEPGEDPLSAAIRELKEETGMVFKTYKLLTVQDLGNDRLDWWAFRFVATDYVETVEAHSDAGERIVVETVDFARAKELSTDNVFMSLEVMNKVHTLHELLALPELSADNR
jgi:ADP-ribose pyrophosphatase